MKSAFLSLAIPAVSLGLVVAAAPAAAMVEFDGKWSVRVVADAGDCHGRTVPIRVSDGEISYGGLFGAVANGKVSENGRIQARMAHAGDVVTVTGSLDGNAGSGRWTSPTLDCGGSWIARKS